MVFQEHRALQGYPGTEGSLLVQRAWKVGWIRFSPFFPKKVRKEVYKKEREDKNRKEPVQPKKKHPLLIPWCAWHLPWPFICMETGAFRIETEKLFIFKNLEKFIKNLIFGSKGKISYRDYIICSDVLCSAWTIESVPLLSNGNPAVCCG